MLYWRSKSRGEVAKKGVLSISDRTRGPKARRRTSVQAANARGFESHWGMGMPRVEFLYWQDCPSHTEALERMRKVMADMGDQSPIELIEVFTEGDAGRLDFPGSPTIRIDGKDVDPSGAEKMGTALTCRIYRLEDGRFSPLPSEEMIRQALS